jgi:hypothetical protein
MRWFVSYEAGDGAVPLETGFHEFDTLSEANEFVDRLLSEYPKSLTFTMVEGRAVRSKS